MLIAERGCFNRFLLLFCLDYFLTLDLFEQVGPSSLSSAALDELYSELVRIAQTDQGVKIPMQASPEIMLSNCL